MTLLSLVGWLLLALVVFVVVALYRPLFGLLRYFVLKPWHALLQQGVPLAGHWLMLGRVMPGGIDKFFDALRRVAPDGKTFPDVAMDGIDLRGGGPVLAVCSADGLREVFLHTETYGKGYVFNVVLRRWLGNGLICSEGDVWARERKLLTPLFHLKELRAYLPLINDESRALVKQLAAFDGSPVDDVPSIFAHTALRIIMRAIFGSRLDLDQVWDLWSRNTNCFRAYLISTIFVAPMITQLVPHPRIREFWDTLGKLEALFEHAVEECRRRESDEHESHDLIARMALLKADDGSPAISTGLIVDECKTLSFAAQDTTSNLLSWALFFLAAAPDVQEQLRDEATSVVPSALGDVSSETLGELKLHRAVLQETLRLRPPVPVMGRHVQRDATICGVQVKEGQVIDAVLGAPALSEEHFVNASQFLPQRWLDGSLNNRHAFCFLPFSAGSRNCIGSKLALQEATVLLFHIVRSFRVAVPNPESVVCAFKGTAEPQNMRVFFEKL